METNKTPDKTVFNVPDAYFDTLYNEIISNKPQRKGGFTWPKMAVASLSLTSLCLLLWFALPIDTQTSDCTTLSCISDKELLLVSENIDYATLVDFVSAQEDVSLEKINVGLNDLNEEEISNYLNN